MLVETALSVPKSECEGNHCCMCATFAADVCCTLHDVEARAISLYETYTNKRRPEKTCEAAMQTIMMRMSAVMMPLRMMLTMLSKECTRPSSSVL